MTTNYSRAALICAASVTVTSCSHAPSVEIVGSFFPIGMALSDDCGDSHILRAQGAGPPEARVGVGPVALLDPSMVVSFSCLLWLVFFDRRSPWNVHLNTNSPASRPDYRLWNRSTAVVLLFITLHQTNSQPRTDDENVRANYIQIVAEVDGRVVDLPVKYNQLVKKGDLLFAIDPRPHEYALRQALADQENLEQKIIDERRKIAAQGSAVEAARATLAASTMAIKTANSSSMYRKPPSRVRRRPPLPPKHNWLLAKNNLNRVEWLLEKQYVTVEQVDTERTQVASRSRKLRRSSGSTLTGSSAASSGRVPPEGV